MLRMNVRPSKHLRHLIRAYQYMDVPAHPEGFVVPAQERGMLLLPTHTDYEPAGELAGRVEIHEATFVGPHTKAIINRTDRPVRGYSVDFTPLGLSLLLGLPQSELVDRGVDAKAILPPAEVEGLLERVHERQAPVGGFAELDAFFTSMERRLGDPGKTSYALVHRALELAFRQQRLGLASQATVARLSEETGRTPRHLNRLFHHTVGLAPKKYLLISRISRAMALIAAHPTVDLSRIACESGFFDYAHFSRAFKEATLVSPREFRSSAMHQEYGVVAADPQELTQA